MVVDADDDAVLETVEDPVVVPVLEPDLDMVDETEVVTVDDCESESVLVKLDDALSLIVLLTVVVNDVDPLSDTVLEAESL